jgi:FAD/FMN-containing dehydrogenase
VTWRELDMVAQPHGLRLPPDPSSGAFCTIGGMVATNAAGARTVRYGPMRPWVHGIEMVTGDGEAVRLARDVDQHVGTHGTKRRFAQDVEPRLWAAAATVVERFPKTRKNTAGYALDHYLRSGQLIDLLIGSEGTLGIITGIELALDRRPTAVTSLLLPLPDLDTLPNRVEAVRAFDPAAIEFLDRSFLEIAQYDDPAGSGWAGVLLVDFDGDVAEVTDTVHRAATAAGGSGAQVAVEPTERERLWALRHAASPVLARLPDTRRSLQVVEDGCVPVPHLGHYITAVHRLAEDIGVPIVAFGHAGDGHLHVNALADTTDVHCLARLRDLLHEVTRLVIDLGGTPSGEHGDGRLRADGVADLYGPDVVDLFRAVKAAFDPAGVLNPGIIVPHGAADPLDDLKVGSGVVEIPSDIAAALRTIEATGDWGTSRLQLPATGPPH